MNTEDTHLWLRVELHVHTAASTDSLVSLQLINHCQRIGIDRAAITDHNSIDGALRLTPWRLNGSSSGKRSKPPRANSSGIS